MDGKTRAHIRPGARVRVVQKQDQRSGKLTEGIVQSILTSSPNHPHGIKVRLVSGVVGRVKEILTPDYFPKDRTNRRRKTLEAPGENMAATALTAGLAAPSQVSARSLRPASKPKPHPPQRAFTSNLFFLPFKPADYVPVEPLIFQSASTSDDRRFLSRAAVAQAAPVDSAGDDRFDRGTALH